MRKATSLQHVHVCAHDYYCTIERTSGNISCVHPSGEATEQNGCAGYGTYELSASVAYAFKDVTSPPHISFSKNSTAVGVLQRLLAQAPTCCSASTAYEHGPGTNSFSLSTFNGPVFSLSTLLKTPPKATAGAFFKHWELALRTSYAPGPFDKEVRRRRCRTHSETESADQRETQKERALFGEGVRSNKA